MIAWDESRVGRAHRRPAFVRFSTLLCKPMTPSHRPIVEGARIGKQAAHIRIAVGAGSGVAQPAEEQGEIGAVASHALEEVLCQGQIVRPRSEQAELAAEAAAYVVSKPVVNASTSCASLTAASLSSASIGKSVSARRARFHCAMGG